MNLRKEILSTNDKWISYRSICIVNWQLDQSQSYDPFRNATISNNSIYIKGTSILIASIIINWIDVIRLANHRVFSNEFFTKGKKMKEKIIRWFCFVCPIFSWFVQQDFDIYKDSRSGSIRYWKVVWVLQAAVIAEARFRPSLTRPNHLEVLSNWWSVEHNRGSSRLPGQS